MAKSLKDLESEMRAVARGERKPSTAPQERPATDLVSALTPANRKLMQVIASRSLTVSQLAEATGRSQPNVSRALQDLARVGLVRLDRDGQAIRPVLLARHVDIDLEHDVCRIVPAAE